MGQFIIFALMMVVLFAGIFAYFVPSQKAATPLGFIMDKSGDNSQETSNSKTTKQLNVTMRNGLIQIRRQMDDVARAQNKFLDTIQDQQEVLENAGKDANDIMLQAQAISGKNDMDILRLKDLTSQMQDEQRLLVVNGKDLIALNDQITQSRQWISDQIDLDKVNTDISLSTLQQHYAVLNHRASVFFHKVIRHDQEVRDQMDRIQGQMNDLVNNAANNSALQQQNIKDHIRRMLAKEHENMLKLADTEERNRNLLKDEEQKLADFQEQLNDSLQRSRDLMDEEHQKAQNQQEMMRQRMEDLKQQMQDRQNR